MQHTRVCITLNYVHVNPHPQSIGVKKAALQQSRFVSFMSTNNYVSFSLADFINLMVSINQSRDMSIMIIIMIMKDGWGLQQWLTSPITRKDAKCNQQNTDFMDI